MSDEIEAITEVASAIGKVAELVKDAGHYAAEVLGTIPHDLVGIVGGDKLRARRLRNIQQLTAETLPRLENIDAARISEPSPSVLLPLLTSSMDEERAQLRDLWSRLLANAAVDGGRRVRREFFETLKRMEPLDAVILDIVDEQSFQNPLDTNQQLTNLKNLLEHRQITGGADDLQVRVSLNALEELKCLVRPNQAVRIISPYGKAFKLACRVE